MELTVGGGKKPPKESHVSESDRLTKHAKYDRELLAIMCNCKSLSCVTKEPLLDDVVIIEIDVFGGIPGGGHYFLSSR